MYLLQQTIFKVCTVMRFALTKSLPCIIWFNYLELLWTVLDQYIYTSMMYNYYYLYYYYCYY